MTRARIIGIWVTLLLFAGGLFAPRFAVSAHAICLLPAVQQRTCPAPVTVATPSCCRARAVHQIAPSAASSRSCCGFKIVGERSAAPATLPVPPVLATLPTLAVAAPSPVVTVRVSLRPAVDNDAPRGLPRSALHPRAPPLS